MPRPLHQLLPTLIAIILIPACTPAPVHTPDPTPSPLTNLLSHASALCLCEITDIIQKDHRPADGNLEDIVTLKPLQSSGLIRNPLHITRAQGGLQAPGSEPWKPTGPLANNPLQKNQRYWILFASENQWNLYHEGVLAYWPESQAPTKELQAAINEDRFAWSPQYDPKSNLTYARKTNPQNTAWTLRVTRNEKILWQTTLPGTPSTRYLAWALTDKAHHPDLAALPIPNDAPILRTETATTLPSDNRFHLPADTYYLAQAFDLHTGNILATWIYAHTPYCQEHYFEALHPQTHQPLTTRSSPPAK